MFFDFTLPNPTTWFYFSLFLTLSLFFNFSRFLSLRNWDVLALFLFAPGVLLLQGQPQTDERGTSQAIGTESVSVSEDDSPATSRVVLAGYVWLMAASGYWLVRCLADLALARRPLPTANLTTPALLFFAIALAICLTIVAFRRPAEPPAAAETPIVAATSASSSSTAWPPLTSEVVFRRGFALICQAGILLALLLIGYWHFSDLPTGVMAMSLFLLIPYTAYSVGRAEEIWPALLLVWAILFYRRPTIAGGILGVAAGTCFFPVLIIPAWLQFYRGRGTGRFFTAFLIGGLCVVGMTLGSSQFVHSQFGLEVGSAAFSEWLPWQVPSSESIWSGTHWAYRLPVFLVVVAFAFTACLWPPVRDFGDLVAITAATSIASQFWLGDEGGRHILWYAPLLVIVVVRPNVTDLVAPVPGPIGFWRDRRAELNLPSDNPATAAA